MTPEGKIGLELLIENGTPNYASVLTNNSSA
ncbi:MAG: hypothetical protein ACRCZU_10730 [Selenomonadaceae bacterium]